MSRLILQINAILITYIDANSTGHRSCNESVGARTSQLRARAKFKLSSMIEGMITSAVECGPRGNGSTKTF
jgi:hypothetical protein